MGRDSLKNQKSRIFSFLIFCALLAACTGSPTLTSSPSPSATRIEHTLPPSHTPTSTKKPIVTWTHTPTDTPGPSLTPTPTSTFFPISPVTPLGPHPLALDEWNAAAGMKRLSLFGSGEPNDLAWSPDGKTLAVATGRGIFLYDGATYEQTGFIDVQDSVSTFVFSPDGRYIALAVRGNVSLWDITSGNRIMDYESDLDEIWKLAFGKGGYIAVVGKSFEGWSIDQKVLLWEISSSQPIISETTEYEWTQAIDFSPDGKIFAYPSQNDYEPPVVKLYDISSKKVNAEIDVYATNLAFNADGTLLFITALPIESGKIWDLQKQTLTDFSDNCAGYISKSEKVIACYGNGHAVNFVDRMTGTKIQALMIGPGFTELAVNPDGAIIATIDSLDQVGVNIIAANDQQQVKSLEFDTFQKITVGMGFVDNEERFLAAAYDPSRLINIWDLQQGVILRTIPIDHEVKGLIFSPDHRTLVSVADTGIVHLWDLQSATLTREINPRHKLGDPLAFTQDGLNVFFGEDSEIVLLSLQTGEIKRIPVGFMNVITPGNRILTQKYENNGSISLRDVETKDRILFPYLPEGFENYGDSVYLDAIALNRNGALFSAANAEGSIYTWSMDTQKLISILEGHGMRGGDGWVGSIQSLKFSPQTDLLVSVGYDGTTRLWNITTGNEIRRLNVCCFADFTPDGRYLVTAGDGVIRLWGLP
jgi:WD40 repeat protein